MRIEIGKSKIFISVIIQYSILDFLFLLSSLGIIEILILCFRLWSLLT